MSERNKRKKTIKENRTEKIFYLCNNFVIFSPQLQLFLKVKLNFMLKYSNIKRKFRS